MTRPFRICPAVSNQPRRVRSSDRQERAASNALDLSAASPIGFPYEVREVFSSPDAPLGLRWLLDRWRGLAGARRNLFCHRHFFGAWGIGWDALRADIALLRRSASHRT